jgi:hypothetical protein
LIRSPLPPNSGFTGCFAAPQNKSCFPVFHEQAVEFHCFSGAACDSQTQGQI